MTTISTLVTYALVIIGAIIPVPYMVEMPGPVFNTLGKHEGAEVVTISGAKTYPTSGTLDMLTVAVAGGPGRKVYPSQAFWSVVKKQDTVVPSEAYYPLTTTRDQVTQENNAQMATSQDFAVAAALNHLGKKYETRLGIGSVAAGAAVEGVVEPGDIITKLNGEKINGSAEDIARVQDTVAKGDPVELDIERDGKKLHEKITPKGTADGPKLGVVLAPTYDFPIDVKFNLEDVGGPSAGLVFALTIIDKLEPGDMTGGKRIAGTGQIAEDGTVSPIGGARQKVVAANEAGVEYFLSPAGNCAEAAQAAKGLDMKVVRVDTLDTAVNAIDAMTNDDIGTVTLCSG
ncbi:S16 family serine protease [Brevibacterium sp. UMB1308A]|uniref:YlbL family protein n=1 Tax=Brevibacterium sp. UMB1308A TaxID=3050608 RepID=UPI00254E12F4|nr:S16 family serine protease [Brevibacterium sp. UMB1308A]MDK8713154.1 S16 family serine protease [Brevibacterium sp. UMB1308A]